MTRRCAIIGAGRVGSTLGGRLLSAGWAVRYGSRNPTHSHRLHATLKAQPQASGGSVADAVEWAGPGGVVLLAVPGSALGTDQACAAFARSLGPHAAGKVVIDATNPLDRQGSELCWERGRSSAEVLQQALPGGGRAHGRPQRLPGHRPAPLPHVRRRRGAAGRGGAAGGGGGIPAVLGGARAVRPKPGGACRVVHPFGGRNGRRLLGRARRQPPLPLPDHCSQPAMDPDLIGRDAGEVGSQVDHILAPPAASVEGLPYSEERQTAEDHGTLQSGCTEHIMQPPPCVPHQTERHQEDWERDAD